MNVFYNIVSSEATKYRLYYYSEIPSKRFDIFLAISEFFDEFFCNITACVE